MTNAKSLFFDSDMYNTCYQNKCNSWHTPHTNDDWYGTNNQPPEEASGWWHDYEGNDREAWTIDAEWYTDEWFNKEEKRRGKHSNKVDKPPTKKPKITEEASGGESSQEET